MDIGYKVEIQMSKLKYQINLRITNWYESTNVKFKNVNINKKMLVQLFVVFCHLDFEIGIFLSSPVNRFKYFSGKELTGTYSSGK